MRYDSRPVRSKAPQASADALAHRTSNGVDGQEFLTVVGAPEVILGL